MNTEKEKWIILETWFLACIHKPFYKPSGSDCISNILFYKSMSKLISYLQIRHNFAKSFSKEPCLCDVYHKTRRQADDGHQHVGKGEIHYEIVGHGAHVAVFPHCKTNWKGCTIKDHPRAQQWQIFITLV